MGQTRFVYAFIHRYSPWLDLKAHKLANKLPISPPTPLIAPQTPLSASLILLIGLLDSPCWPSYPRLVLDSLADVKAPEASSLTLRAFWQNFRPLTGF